MYKFFPTFRLTLFFNIALMLTFSLHAYNQIPTNETRYVRIGSLHNHYTAYGSERAWNNYYCEGLQWPAEYLYQDNSVIERNWIGTINYIDKDSTQWEAYGIYLTAGLVDKAIFPVELKQSAKFAPPTVIVDGIRVSVPYESDVDEVNPNQIPDRIITNVVNTSMGLTIKRTVYAFSQQYHDNYHIKIFTYKNTGNTDYNDEIERHGPLHAVRIGRGIRYSLSREGAARIGTGQSWGQHSWITRRGENYVEHYTEPITLTNPIVDWLRCGFSWEGQAQFNTSYDNIGAPYVTKDGRLTSPHHAGIGILHVDQSASVNDDNPYQPTTLGWHAGDSYPIIANMSSTEIPQMVALYNMLSGEPYQGLGGNERFYENYIDISDDPWLIHNDAGGTNLWINYGPFDLNEGDSVVIVEVEGVNGINRKLCELIGRRWKQAYLDANDEGPFGLPDGSTTTDKDEYKNSWVFTGQDSILLTFSRAKRNFDLGFNIPMPPEPPTLFEVNSGITSINLSWLLSPSEGKTDFAGYKIFRSVNKPDTTYELIGILPPGTYSFIDSLCVPGFSYYYYILAFDDGSNNRSEANPHGSLHSNKFYTRTTESAYILGNGIEDSNQRLVPTSFYLYQNFPNPFNPSTNILYSIPNSEFVTLKVYDMLGSEIQTLVSEFQKADTYSVNFGASKLSSGIYFYRLQVGSEFLETKKMLYLR